jgi:hypothetical protein
MRFWLLIGCLLLLCGCQAEAPLVDSPPRPQTAQITYIGGMFLNSSLNGIVDKERSIRRIRRSLRKPLWGLYELLKGPEIVRLETLTVSAIYRPMGADAKLPHPGLAEIFSLAGIDQISLAVPALAAADKSELASTVKALEAVGIGAVGLAAQTEQGAGTRIDVRVVDLEDARVAFLGLYLSEEEVAGDNGVAAFSFDEREAAVAAVKSALDGVGDDADLGFLMLGWHSKTDLAERREICHALIDEAGVDAILSHHAGAFEGIEAHGKGLIFHNPGPALLMNLDKTAVRPALVFRIHLADGAVSWVEVQPIEAHRKRVKIGMDREHTHGTINRLVRLSKELGTTITNEHGRGIWEPSAEK